MAERFRAQAGGIRGLLSFLDEHSEAVEYDLIDRGLRLDWVGTVELSWRDLLVIIRNAPRTSAIFRSTVGVEAANWSLEAQLLAAAVDELRWLHWVKTKNPGSRANPQPDPIPRPGVELPKDPEVMGSNPVSLEAIDEWLGWNTPEVQAIGEAMEQLDNDGGVTDG